MASVATSLHFYEAHVKVAAEIQACVNLEWHAYGGAGGDQQQTKSYMQ